MANLYQITGAALALQELLEAGDIDETAYNDTLEGLCVEDKVQGICHVIRNLEAQAEMFKAEKDRLAAREKTAKNGVARLKDSLLQHMQLLNKKKVEAGTFTVSRATSTSVNVYDVTELPEKFLIYPDPSPDKLEIGRLLKAGETVNGAELVQKESVRIR